jgi:solute carrier family 13 (sodium-dependent dicarboxylate transporter), member 2/3/5
MTPAFAPPSPVYETHQPTIHLFGARLAATSDRVRRRSGQIAAGFAGASLAAIWSAPGGTIDARVTLTVFVVAIAAWMCDRYDDTLVAVTAAIAVVVAADVSPETLFTSLGESTVWLLIASFVLAAAVTTTGLADRYALRIVRGAPTVTALFWRVSGGLCASTFLVPATSGRAAMALPIYVGLSRAVADRRISRALALLMPSIILLSAGGSLLGAGAHLVTLELLSQAGEESIGFGHWLLLGTPFALASSATAVIAITRLFLTAEERSRPLDIDEALTTNSPGATGAPTNAQNRVKWVLIATLVTWATTSVHGYSPAIIALIAAVVLCAPSTGVITLAKALDHVPWNLLLFLAATLALGHALVASGAAAWLTGGFLDRASALPTFAVIAAVIAVSLIAHLLIGSRSARSGVLIPIVILLAGTTGINASALAFVSTMAAGYCLTLVVSAKPVAMFANPHDDPMVATFSPADLLRLSAILVPVHLVLLSVFAVAVWPILGLPL